MKSLIINDGASLKYYIIFDDLKVITFGTHFDESLDNIKFSDSVESIIFDSIYDKPLKNVIFPTNLKAIAFSKKFNESLKDFTFPDSLESIAICSDIDINNIHFPKTVQYVKFFN